MGPIERELRARAALRNLLVDSANWLSYEAFCLLMGAENSLRVHGPIQYSGRTSETQAQLDALWPDIYSEAIEAAEALGL